MTNRGPITFLGIELGTATGGDGELGDCWWVYNFQPNADCEFPACAILQFNEIDAMIHARDAKGNNIKSWSIQWKGTPL